jgi:hypothetical protein
VTRVIDFGIAKGRNRVHRTRTGVMKGKIAFASPEQIAGEPLDLRADIYSVGITIWRMLAAKLPITAADDVAVMHRKLTEDVPRLSTSIEVALHIDDAIARATLREPNGRYAHMREMLSALLAGAPQPASTYAVSEWLTQIGSAQLVDRADRVTRILCAPEVTETTQTMPKRLSKATTSGVALAALAALIAAFVGVQLGRSERATAASSFAAAIPVVPLVDTARVEAEPSPSVSASASVPSRRAPARRPGVRLPKPPPKGWVDNDLLGSE